MIWNTIDFVCRETALHLRRERVIAIATVSTVAVLFLLLGTMVLTLVDVWTLTQHIGGELQVSAYFETEYPRESATAAAEEIEGWEEVREARFVSKEEGWEKMRGELASSDTLGGMENPLPDCVHVFVQDPEMLLQVAERLKGIDGVKDVVTHEGFVQSLVKARRIISGAGGLLGILVAVAGIAIVHNTIRLALHSRWREIYIMQLIGAGRAVIAAPFLLEGIVHGGLGAALACCVLIPGHMYLRSLSERSVPFLLLAPDSMLLTFGITVVLVGAVLGLTGSAFSVRRYLRRRPEWHS